ncbi:hypothetical protein [Cellulomonas cellasea]|uniref:Putative HAF family extracellular repeat protein n=1 Tax=Cellulomonas cellasea TaxID=43670 RepID=A0A7W4UBT3_9CELL|nr:hypothetical protein [Cellulomonas cellasea]MBB2921298.1 putative HAF family extracellular repeat protein [Cellulomonas cellasea]
MPTNTTLTAITVAVALGLVGAPAPAGAATSTPDGPGVVYEIQYLGNLGMAWGQATDVNASGVITGSTQDAEGWYRAFVWDPQTGVMTGIPNGPFIQTEGVGINNRGQVVGVGTLEVPFDTSRAFVWDPRTGVTTALGTLGGQGSIAMAINDRGQVTGSSTTVDGQRHPFMWDPRTGVMTDLGTLGGDSPGASWVSGYGINNRGQVAGVSLAPGGAERAFRWDPRTRVMTDLGTLPGQTTAFAWDINAAGDVAGWSAGEAGGSGVVWSASTGAITAVPCDLLGINDRGDAVGSGVLAGEFVGCVWSNRTGEVTYLPALDAGGYSGGWDISNSGVIAGYSGLSLTAVRWTPTRARS